MAYKKFKFDPEGGFSDSSFYEDTPENPREILQRQHNQTRDYINSLVDTLNSENEGSSGSESIMSPKIEGVNGNNVYEQLKDIKRQINYSFEGVIPDSSVSEVKIKDGAITEAKIKDGEISSSKFKEDAKVPFANETLNVNGIKSSEYHPIGNTGFCGMLKELFYKGEITSIAGKTYGDKRYIMNSNILYTLSLENGEMEKYSDFEFLKNCKFAIKDNETVFYAVSSKSSDSNTNITVYKYEKKYKSSIQVAVVKLKIDFSSFGFFDIDVNDTHFFIGAGRSTSGYTKYYYKIPLEELKEDITPVITYSFSSNSSGRELFLADGDIFFANRIFENTDTEEVITLYDNVRSCDNFGNILLKNEMFPIWDRETLLPKCAELYSYERDTNGFLYNNYLYVLVNKYLFKTRIF